MKILQNIFKEFVVSNKLTVLVSLFVLLLTSCKQKENTKYIIKPSTKIATIYSTYIDSCSVALNTIKEVKERENKQQAFFKSREYFKKIEPVLLRFEKNNLNVLNGPNLKKISEEDKTDIKIFEPQGFQVLEEVLFSEEAIDNVFLTQKINFIQSKLGFMKQNNFIEKKSLANFLEMMKLTTVNIALKGITGFDSPVINNSLNEAMFNYEVLIEFVRVLEGEYKNKELYKEVLNEFKSSIGFLKSNDYKNFDRYTFIKKHVQNQLELINKTAEDWNVEMTTNLAMNFNASKIFSRSFFNDKSFSFAHLPNENIKVTELGKRLFYDTKLSKNNKMSCATCHSPKKGFTDGLPKAIGNNGQELLRNSPTVAYSQYQRGLFYDKRVSSLESQILKVIDNKDEFHEDITHIVKYVSNNETYKKSFKAYYKDSVTSLNVRHAISNYTRSLATFSSKFDKNMNGEEATLTAKEKQGFNIFMGKGLCASCHFPPLFNGTVPPNFSETELEIIGVPKTSENKVIDPDKGRYEIFKTEERMFAFKTPTIRNINSTAPYMHNGVYNTLDEVMDFYNKGGGEGLGFEVPNQTLPFDNLQLTEEEIKAVIAFMETLTDETY